MQEVDNDTVFIDLVKRESVYFIPGQAFSEIHYYKTVGGAEKAWGWISIRFHSRKKR